jgi:hypothetical protein
VRRCGHNATVIIGIASQYFIIILVVIVTVRVAALLASSATPRGR